VASADRNQSTKGITGAAEEIVHIKAVKTTNESREVEISWSICDSDSASESRTEIPTAGGSFLA